MKKLMCLLLALLLLSGCAALEEEFRSLPTPTASAAVSPAASASLSPSRTDAPLPTVSPTPLLSPSPTPTPPFPDIAFSGEPSANSSAMLYEDEENIYFSDYSTLYQINKTDRSIAEIAFGCINLTLLDGSVYYTPAGEDEAYDTIAVYNPANGQSHEVLRQPYGVSVLAGYKHRLYFTCISGPWDDYDFPLTDLYSCNADGSNVKLIKEDVETFCISRDIIYYTLSSYPDGAPLWSCKLDGSKAQELHDWIYCDFDVNDGWLYCCYTDKEIICNLSSGSELALMPTQTCVLSGQYAFYIIYDARPALRALDLNTRVSYTLAKLPEGFYTLEATDTAVYLCDDYTGSISRINVQNGAVNLDMVVQSSMGWY